MQTLFTETQLRDPEIATSNAVLRTCVHCGLCTATCPTFLLLGDELDSPRGRIYLIKDMLESGRPATEDVVRHVDRCLSCLSCMSTCPSGVNYMHLVDYARVHIERTYARPWHEKLLRGALARVLPRPGLLRLVLLGSKLAQPFVALLPGQSVLVRRLRAMFALLPKTVHGREQIDLPRIYPAQGERRARVALLTGCAQKVLDPEINAATVRLLTRLGVEVVVAKGAGCCGALTHHMGKVDFAKTAAAANIKAWARELDGPGLEGQGLDAVVINASGCGTMVKDYAHLFRTDPGPLRQQAEKISAIAMDITEFLARHGYAPTREAPGLTVAYHAACSLQHGQKITEAPKALLRRAGFTLREPAESHICCGSAGTYNLLQPEIAGRLKLRKLQNLRATKADLIAAGNIGCLTQLAGDALPVVHTVQLLDWMAGGPKPVALGD